jgi:hypothetical protein
VSSRISNVSKLCRKRKSWSLRVTLVGGGHDRLDPVKLQTSNNKGDEQ